MKVRAYFNLHKKLWSVVALEGLNKGRVIAHCTSVMIDNVVFKVSQAGRNRLLKEQCKNVHAGAVGDLAWFKGETRYSEYAFYNDLAPTGAMSVQGTAKVTYQPYKHDCFVTNYNESVQFPVRGASRTFLSAQGVLAWGADIIREQVRNSHNQFSFNF